MLFHEVMLDVMSQGTHERSSFMFWTRNLVHAANDDHPPGGGGSGSGGGSDDEGGGDGGGGKD